jgi:KamA family protein
MPADDQAARRPRMPTRFLGGGDGTMTRIRTVELRQIPGHGPAAERIASRDFHVYTERTIDRIPQLARLGAATRFDMKVVASVLPFRVNNYVIDQLIDWQQVPEDPVFQLCFPQRGMLSSEIFDLMAALFRRGASSQEIKDAARRCRAQLNPHPAGQQHLNLPRDDDGCIIDGLQHKYQQTALFFPASGQTCHSYCTFCFRWAQFVGDRELRISADDVVRVHSYLAAHREITDLLITGGDPMVMSSRRLHSYLRPLIERRFAHIQTVRIGTKALSFWPYRFVTDDDSRELLALLRSLSLSGKHIAVMAHYNHWRELETDIAQEAIRRVRATGAEIRSQGPLLRHINDDAEVWARLWQRQVQLGIVPYYLFVERDTGAKRYFEVPLLRAWQIYRGAMQQVSGLGRTARGPSMSTGPGKIEIQGTAQVRGEKVFVLRFIQGRNPDWVQRPFFAKLDPTATWLDQLQPAFGEQEFFFEAEYREIRKRAAAARGTG